LLIRPPSRPRPSVCANMFAFGLSILFYSRDEELVPLAWRQVGGRPSRVRICSPFRRIATRGVPRVVLHSTRAELCTRTYAEISRLFSQPSRRPTRIGEASFPLPELAFPNYELAPLRFSHRLFLWSLRLQFFRESYSNAYSKTCCRLVRTS